MIRRAVALGVATALAIGVLPPATAQDFQPSTESPETLPAGPGREETFAVCTGCHSFALVRAQGLSAERWDDTVDYMIERHGMAEIPAEHRELIVRYLASNFPPKESPRGWTNPFLPR